MRDRKAVCDVRRETAQLHTGVAKRAQPSREWVRWRTMAIG